MKKLFGLVVAVSLQVSLAQAQNPPPPNPPSRLEDTPAPDSNLTDPGYEQQQVRQPKSPIAAPTEVKKSSKAPVVTPVPGNFGMSFLFGGLAPLSVAGFNGLVVNQRAFSEIGFRAVTRHVVIPFSLGVGIFSTKPDAAPEATTDAGLSASVGVLRGFRMWRRISPYFGGMFHLSWLDPAGPGNWVINMTIGPVIGIEYFVADRVSLFAQAELQLGMAITDPAIQVGLATIISGGGQLGLTFYF